MDLTLSLQDDPNATVEEAKRHRKQLGINQDHSGNESKVVTDIDDQIKLSSSYGNLNSTVYDPTTELTEEDIFRMKNIRKANLVSETEELGSAISVVDSASNVEERLATTDTESTEGADEESPNENSLDIPTNLIPPQRPRSSDDYVFGRSNNPDIKLNPETVTELRYPFVPSHSLPTIPEQAYSNSFTAARVFLIGTAHFSVESQNDVRKTIQAVQPDLVMVELCSARIAILSMDEQLLLREARNLNYDSMMSIIRQSGFVQGILHILLLSTSANITRQLGMAPGGEFRVAHEASRQVRGCQVVLGDRPIQITLQRALNSLSFFQKIRLFFRIIMSNNIVITQEDVEQCKNKDLLEELLKEMAGEFPQLSKIFVQERDIYMTHILHQLIYNTTVAKWNVSKRHSLPFEPVNVVAVVGIGHVPGIVENWSKRLDGYDLLSVPEASKASKAIKLVVRIAFLGGCGYGIYWLSAKLVSKCPDKVF